MERSLLKSRYSIFFIIFLSAQSFSQPALSIKNTSYTYLKSNLEFLASDELEGREATSRGEKIAALFISEELEKYGVLPFGDSGSYYQDFNMIVSRYDENSKVSFLGKDGLQEEYIHGNEVFFSSRSWPGNDYANKEFEIVYVGYGITSEADNYDSYRDLNVEGKVVLLINGTPTIDGKEVLSKGIITKYGKYSDKAKLAQSNGASGIIVLPNDEINNYWKYFQKWSNLKSFRLEDEVNTSQNSQSIPILILNENSAKKLLLKEEFSFNDLLNDSEVVQKSFTLNTKVNLKYEFVVEKKLSRNVIGIIKGNKENLEREYLTIGAHYDHEGIKNGEIYNGADDNGSGIVTVLEVARKLSLNTKNDRPVVVIFHAAEEKGLKGAKYLVNNSEFVNETIVHMNIDMIGRRSEDSIYCIGASKISEELGKLVEEVNSYTSNFVLDYTFDKPNDPEKLYYRSDHIHYVNKGIPIVFFYDDMKKDYHKPTDTVEKINFSKLLKMTDLVYNLALKISNLDHKLQVPNN